jgi:hypothetical protein
MLPLSGATRNHCVPCFASIRDQRGSVPPNMPGDGPLCSVGSFSHLAHMPLTYGAIGLRLETLS